MSEQRPGDGKQLQNHGYKTGEGYIGVIQEANELLKSVEGRKAIRKAAFDKAMEASVQEEPAPNWFERNVPAILELFRNRHFNTGLRWVVRLILLCAVIWEGSRLREELLKEEAPPPTPEDVLINIDESSPDFDGVKNYVQYIVNKVAAGGMEAVAGKWIEGIDPSFKGEAKAQLELLGAGFKSERISADKAVVYNVECHPDINPERIVTVEVVKGRLGSGKAVYRLQRVY